jgi:hypothetical protein
MRLGMKYLWAIAVVAAYGVTTAVAQPPYEPKPVPRMQALPLPQDQASFQDDGRELTRLHFGANLKRPFLYPIVGPAGRSLTRMGHPQDPHGHRHHNSVWISHHDVAGVDFWSDSGDGRIVTEQVIKYDDDAAAVTIQNAWRGKDGTVLIKETRRTEVRPLADGEWLLILDLILTANGKDIVLGKTPFGLVGVRMAKTIGVNDGGGTIRNSAGAVNEIDILWKPARWVDYSGPITRTATEGVALLDHPKNPNHPTVFHVRNDGWMGASLTQREPRTIRAGEPLALRYGLLVHRGQPSVDDLERRFGEFSQLEIKPLPSK